MQRVTVIIAILFSACTNSSKTDSSGSDSLDVNPLTGNVVVDTATVGEEAEDTVERIMKTDANDPEIGGDMVTELAWQYTFYGFLEDNHILAAYEQSGSADPENTTVGELEFYVVDVRKNDYASKPYKAANSPAGKEYVTDYIADHNLSVPNYQKVDLAAMNDDPKLVINNKVYNVRLLQRSTSNNSVLMELQLINQQSGQGWMLQSDASLPKSRGEVLEYHLADTYIENDNVAIMIKYTRTQLDKNQNEYWIYKYLMVTGSVASKPNFKYEASKTVTCSLENIQGGTCPSVRFSCGDFGDAQVFLPFEDLAYWNDLKDSNFEIKPQYKGKSFDITYTTTYGRPCRSRIGENTVYMLTGFKINN